MRIGIDARTLLANTRGFRRLRGLLEAFFSQRQGEELVYFAPEGDRPGPWSPLPKHIRWETPERRLRMLHRRHVGLIGSRVFRDLDVFHFPTAEVWYSKFAPTVVTLHDLTPLHCSDRFFATLRERDKYEKHLQQIVKIADRIATVSEYSRKDLVETLGLQPERVRVIYQGYEDFSRAAASEPLDVFQAMSIPGPYLLYCGGLDFRKNVEGLIRGFSIYRREYKGRCVLVIVGSRDPARASFYPDLKLCAEKGDVEDAVFLPGWVEDRILGALYRQAEAFVYPSLFEGFGYSPLEAMAAGVPVVCSQAASLPEVVGEAALLVDATDPVQLAEAMKRVEEDQELRKQLVDRGRANLARFRWEKAAGQFLELYREVAKEAGRL